MQTEGRNILNGAGGRRSAVVIAEDEPAVRDFIALVLTRAGYRTITASGAAEAIRKVRQDAGPITLLISDIRMPGGNGLDLAVAMQAATPQLPVLYISGLIDSVAVQSILLRDPLAILPKPFDARQLVDRVRTLIGPPLAAAAGAAIPRKNVARQGVRARVSAQRAV